MDLGPFAVHVPRSLKSSRSVSRTQDQASRVSFAPECSQTPALLATLVFVSFGAILEKSTQRTAIRNEMAYIWLGYLWAQLASKN